MTARSSAPRASATRILVTGFGAFPGVPNNPSAALLQRLEAAPPELAGGLSPVFALLPVLWRMPAEDLAVLHTDHAPAAAVHFGVAGSRRMVCIEARARNILSGRRPDAEGAPGPGGPLDADHAGDRTTPLSATALLASVQAQGVAARISRDAGDYLCNATYWHSLARGVPSVFIHIPHPAETAASAGGRPDMAGLERAARAVLRSVAEQIAGP